MKKVTTASGTIYFIDEDAMTVQRCEGPNANRLRRDGEVCKLIEIITLEVGVLMEMMLDIREDGFYKTYRQTTTVGSIEELVQT